jgi:peptidoglycan/LPS O-acetylase OafA/YrhL
MAARSSVALVDALVVLVFAAIGRRSHDEGLAIVGIVEVAAPFLLGALVGALVARSWRDPLALRTGLAVWAGAVVVGLALRAVLYDRLPLSFAIVATVSLAVLVLGWRGAVLGIMRLRARRARQHA